MCVLANDQGQVSFEMLGVIAAVVILILFMSSVIFNESKLTFAMAVVKTEALNVLDNLSEKHVIEKIDYDAESTAFYVHLSPELLNEISLPPSAFQKLAELGYENATVTIK